MTQSDSGDFDLKSLQRDVQSRDLLWSLFVAAARSYRFSSVLHPFPAEYYIEERDQKNIVLLREVINSVPRFVDTDSLKTISTQSLDLVKWVLSTPHFEIQLEDKKKCWKKIMELTGQLVETPEPSFIFKVISSEDKEQRFQDLRNDRDVFFAYHGSRLENFYSILHNGLNGHMNKTSLYGEGTYLSSELSLCLLYSPTGEGWKNSILGSKLGCVAVCEMINDSSVKCQIKEGTSKEKRSRAQASSATDSVPEKYYVVQNNDMLKIRYILVYKSENSQRSQTTSRFGWLKEYRFALMMLGYVLLLLAIGLANSPQTIKRLSSLFKRLSFW